MTERSDAELLAALTDEPEALDEFYRRHRERVVRYATRRCHQPADVADLVAATFLAALGSASRFDPRKGSTEAWLIGVASRQWGRMCRSERKQLDLLASHRRWTLTEDDVSRLEDRIDAARDFADVERAIDDLDERHREVLLLVSYDGLSAGEAAAALGISNGTFRVRLLRARRALRSTLDDHMTTHGFAVTTPQEA